MSGAGPAAPLIVAIDFKQPQSYLAVGPTMKLAAALGIEVDWQPMAARPLRTPEETIGDDRGARHRRFRARYFERDLRRYAETQGLRLGDVYRAADSSVAGMGLLVGEEARRARRRGEDGRRLRARVFDGYWSGGLALDDAAAIRGVLETVGAPAAAFDPASLRAEYESVLEHWRAAGLVDAPAYVLGEEIFLGRAHLPMIEWLHHGQGRPRLPPSEPTTKGDRRACITHRDARLVPRSSRSPPASPPPLSPATTPRSRAPGRSRWSCRASRSRSPWRSRTARPAA